VGPERWTLIAALGPAAALITFVEVSAFKKWALRRKWVDLPNERSSHVRPTPRGGGIVIVGMGLAGLLFAPRTDSWQPIGGYLVGALLVAAVSWIDDLRRVSAGVRLLVHIAATASLLWGTGTSTDLSLPVAGGIHLGLWGIPLFALWVIGLTNAYNFMDGIDGIAAGQALIAAIGWSFLAWASQSMTVFQFSVVLAGSALGFLVHNWSPASVFMGDIGSAFLGFTFAALPLLARSPGTSAPKDTLPLLAVLFVWPFVFDSFFTFLRRLSRREHVFAPHRSHLYQRLVIAGYSHSTVALLYLILAGVGVGTGLFWSVSRISFPLLALPFLALSLWAFTARIERRRSLQMDKIPSDLQHEPSRQADLRIQDLQNQERRS
jgi:UDP-N-acetylmuramyl pentapeptide phosphotransferase/UDP-N-acetylglucosamine-1-phosphate transferase